MALFYIAFDLGKRKSYLKLLRRLAHYQARRVMLSVWALEGDYTSTVLRDDLSQYVDERVLVVEPKSSASCGPIMFGS